MTRVALNGHPLKVPTAEISCSALCGPRCSVLAIGCRLYKYHLCLYSRNISMYVCAVRIIALYPGSAAAVLLCICKVLAL